MSIFAIPNYCQIGENLVTQIPKRLDIDFTFSFITSSATYSLGIDENGVSYIWGRWKGIDAMFSISSALSIPTVVPGLPDVPVIYASCSFRLSAWLLEDGTAYVAGNGFSTIPQKIEADGKVSILSTGIKSVCLFGEFGLRIYTSWSTYTSYNITEGLNVIRISSFRDTFALILDNGELCTLKPIKCNTSIPVDRSDSLFNLSAFSLMKCTYICSNFGFFLVITSDNDVYICNSDNTILVPNRIPGHFPIPLTSASLANGCVYLLDALQHAYVYPLNQLSLPTFSVTPEESILNSDLPFSGISATIEAAYFIVGGPKQPLLSYSLTPASLPGRFLPFFINKILILPKGGESFGFKCGDHVSYNNQSFCVIGTHDNYLYILPLAKSNNQNNNNQQSTLNLKNETNSVETNKNETSKKEITINNKTETFQVETSEFESILNPETIEISDLVTMLMRVQLIKRQDADLQFQDTPFAVDRSSKSLSEICCFKAGDTINSLVHGFGTILGTRANRITIKYSSGVILEDPEAVDLIEREGKTVVSCITIEGHSVLVEKCTSNNLSPGDLVKTELGLGTYIGIIEDRIAVRFLADSDRIRTILSTSLLQPCRTLSETLSAVIGINLKSLIISLRHQHPNIQKSNSNSKLKPKLHNTKFSYNITNNIVVQPEDFVLINGECSRCVGFYNEKPLFETDKMLLENLGVGLIPEQNVSESESNSDTNTNEAADSIDKIIKPEITIVIKVSEELVRQFNSFTFSSNTDDFSSTFLLPFDRIIFQDQLYLVVGISLPSSGKDLQTNLNNNSNTKTLIYVQRELSSSLEAIPTDNLQNVEIILRRLNSVLVKTFIVDGQEINARIDAEAYRGQWFWPGDKVEVERRRYTVYGITGPHKFIVKEDGFSNYQEKILNPLGIFSATLIHRPFSSFVV